VLGDGLHGLAQVDVVELGRLIEHQPWRGEHPVCVGPSGDLPVLEREWT
jgi:hypothetical protein